MSLDEKLESDLLKNGEINLIGDITDETIKYVIPRLRYLDRHLNKSAIIKLFISTSGGDLDAACAIADEIKLIRSRGRLIYTIGFGLVASAGIFILASGSKRYGYENSTFLIHSCSYSADEEHQHNKAFVLFMDQMWNTLLLELAILCEIKKPKDQKEFMSQVKDNLWLNAESAIEFKLIEEKWENNENSIEPGI